MKRRIKIMMLIAGGLILAGLIFGSVVGFSLPVFGILLIGILLMGVSWIQEKEKEERANAWRKNYPTYRY